MRAAFFSVFTTFTKGLGYIILHYNFIVVLFLSCETKVCDPMDCILPGYQPIFQARVLEWGAIL